MILHRQLNRKLSSMVTVVVVVVTAIASAISIPLATDDGVAAAPIELPRSGVLEVVITEDGTLTTTKSISRALSRLEVIRQAEAAEARRPESASPLLVAISVNETTCEFTDLADVNMLLRPKVALSN